MTPDQIKAYRAAAFLQYLRECLAVIGDPIALADWRVDVAAELIKAALGMESNRATSFTERDDIAEVASRVLILNADLQLGRRGAAAGYYPADFGNRVAMFFSMHCRQSLTDLLTTVSETENDLAPAEGGTLSQVLLNQFLSDQAIWRDASTPGLTECLELLAFTSEDRWQRHLNEVKELSDAIQADPSLQLSAEKADRYEWFFEGVPDLLNFTRDSRWLLPPADGGPLLEQVGERRVYLPAIAGTIRSRGVRARFHELMDIREELLNRSQYLTADTSMRTAAWLLAQTDPERAQVRDDVWHWEEP